MGGQINWGSFFLEIPVVISFMDEKGQDSHISILAGYSFNIP
jgi:hypothetical protein